jgi:D-alanine transaminase
VPPAVVITAKPASIRAAEAKAAKGIGVITTPGDPLGPLRHQVVGLLPNSWPSRRPSESGALEAWFVDELGLVTEGASSNAWIVDAEGTLRTRDTKANILRASPARPCWR